MVEARSTLAFGRRERTQRSHGALGLVLLDETDEHVGDDHGGDDTALDQSLTPNDRAMAASNTRVRALAI